MFDWIKYLEFAKFLKDSHALPVDNEAKFRCIVSRAYYSAHCLSRNYLRNKRGRNDIPGDGTAHKVVIEIFAEIYHENNEEIYKQISEELQRLKGARRKADYDDSIPGDIGKFAYTAIIRAENISQSLSSLPKTI